ncbi:MAG: FtsX-like permease family protein [Gammaproteobacteria bacterium]|nr:FtsX-like permease family protein [Gammaproteobacteria bacterium]MBT8106135.1 FtsX-like permease family protein [Gammaproteobacteria bacterium]NNK26149.1 FtsX-like permease family protein [Woeseiaceae bacterium]NNL63783.1 FtsX-like permease family protein [Woeseiaceae bacterium]
MDIGPIWRAMLRNKAGFILIALQIAVTLTILVNAFGIIQESTDKISTESGIDEANTFTLASVLFTDYEREQRKVLIDEDLDLIRNTPGVVNAVASNSFPLRQGGWSMSLALEPGNQTAESVNTAIYFVDEHGMETFDLGLVDGRNFLPEQVTWDDPDDNTWPAYAIITEELAKEIWPDETVSYVGKTVFISDDDPVNIVGVVDKMQAPWPNWDNVVERSMLVPQRRPSEFVRYIVRAEPGMRDQLMPEIEAALAASNKDRIIRDVRTMDHTRKLAYVGDAAMIKILGFVVLLLTLITALGIVGLTSFNVSRRTRQIGIRRALGATQPAIIRYFLIENSIVSAVGLVVGAALAIGLNIAMVEAFALEPLAWYVIPIGMLVLFIVGQFAVTGPARRASNISPAIATRSG